MIAGDWSTFGTWCCVVGSSTRWTPSSSSVTSPGPSGKACTAANGPDARAACRRRLISSSALSSVTFELARSAASRVMFARSEYQYWAPST